jgi:hypothetical protein
VDLEAVPVDLVLLLVILVELVDKQHLEQLVVMLVVQVQAVQAAAHKLVNQVMLAAALAYTVKVLVEMHF